MSHQAVQLGAFDLDGTLVDSMPDIAWAVERMTRELSLPSPASGQVRSWVGDGVRRLVKRVVTGTRDGEPAPDVYQRAFEAFRTAYREHLAVETRLYPGVREALETLQARGLRLACITNKAAEFTTPLLHAFDLHDYFDCVVSGDTLAARKPDPLPLLHVAQHVGIAPAAACMVGDSVNDLLAARAAGFRAVGVRYGYGGEALAGASADAWLDAFTELPPLLESWTAGLVPA